MEIKEPTNSVHQDQNKPNYKYILENRKLINSLTNEKWEDITSTDPKTATTNFYNILKNHIESATYSREIKSEVQYKIIKPWITKSLQNQNPKVDTKGMWNIINEIINTPQNTPIIIEKLLVEENNQKKQLRMVKTKQTT